MHIAFRVDASLAIGTGHVMRCLTLAKELRERGHYCVFICAPHQGHLGNLIGEQRFNVLLLKPNLDSPVSAHKKNTQDNYSHWLGLPQEVDAEQTLKAMGSQYFDWLVVDHYALGAKWHTWVKKHTRGKHKPQKIMVIDDLANRQYACDLLLDQTFGCTQEHYLSFVTPDTFLLMGSQYALLRREFVNERARSLAMRDERIQKIPLEIFINFGGVDEHNVTLMAIQALHACSFKNYHLTVVVGASNPWKNTLFDAINTLSISATLHVGATNMAQLMAASDCAIAACGSTVWELCSLGVPSLLVATALNQQPAIHALAKSGAVFTLGINTLEQELKVIFESAENTQYFAQLSSRCRHIVDGLGVARVALALEEFLVEAY